MLNKKRKKLDIPDSRLRKVSDAKYCGMLDGTE